eukprot:CAMPEP_0184978126 /NCGR_PEP_ID=MMETSP1098-20130426/8734_1 /TAXON_ID=89044 /ORGANISM="Spumella elongata, Strain CCAP 955/1" /LENGTH=102 /DNA_ID=CAMNT_0027501237 /DNA_START=18 /DNA_END=326 /DNA_ORIENTATION=+
MEFYRSSAVGIALTKALNEMLQSEDITMEDALKVLSEFDQSFVENFRDHLHIRKDMELMEVKGTLESYNNLDQYWKIDASDVTATIGKTTVKYDRARFLFKK